MAAVTSTLPGYYFRTDQPITDADVVALSEYAENIPITSAQICEFAKALIPPVAQLIADYVGTDLKTGILEWNRARHIAYPDREERLRSNPCALPERIVSILEQEISPAEKAVWGTKPDGKPYCVSDIYQLVWVNQNELHARIQKLEQMMAKDPNHLYLNLIQSLIKAIKSDLEFTQEGGWALISKMPLPGSEKQELGQIHETLKTLDCDLPPLFLVHTYLLDNTLVYSDNKFALPTFKTHAIGMRRLPLKGPAETGVIANEAIYPAAVSFNPNKVEQIVSLKRGIGTLAVRRWQLPAPMDA